MPNAAHKLLSLVFLLSTAVIGIGALCCFMVFLYAGPFNWLRLDLTELQGMALNTMLSFAFFIQHSGMVRRSFRRRLDGYILPHYQGVSYTLASGIVLFVILVFWQESETLVLDVQGWFEYFMRGSFFLAIAGTVWGMWALRFVDLFGMDAVVKHQQSTSDVAKPFTIRGPYRWVRHPLYLFSIVFFWSYPEITADRLLFNILWTLWVVVGARLEERELVQDFGDDYRAYQAKVPMLLPRSIRPSYSG